MTVWPVLHFSNAKEKKEGCSLFRNALHSWATMAAGMQIMKSGDFA